MSNLSIAIIFLRDEAVLGFYILKKGRISLSGKVAP